MTHMFFNDNQPFNQPKDWCVLVKLLTTIKIRGAILFGF